ncbi:Retrovirus-related Pol polyprotein LINE-1 [Gossypium australe]|uniref:Retrovirus-related Pol polyprotein LINE-1 n=1 Tax=Gossypium australe TaxID=47621 RepID=A0A5B6WG36_9ROSI|nr:Retrovirus-related Pol polyprotein LINE-1 [Gossypium australe]
MWERGRLARNNIRERLGRSVANREWWTRFPDYSLQHLNHNTLGNQMADGLRREASFRLIVDWAVETDFEKRVKTVWNSSNMELPRKLELLGRSLIEWSRMNKEKKHKRREELTLRLNQLNEKDPDDDHLAEITEVKLTLNMEADKEEIYWEQRARAN